MQSIHCIDSHTGGEPTRVVLSGFPDLHDLPLPQAVHELRSRHDQYRRATVCEPRGSDVIVGAVLLPPRTRGALASLIFFNNVGYLGMCGHGTIGAVATLAHLGRIQPGVHAIDTPVGTVQATLHDDCSVTVANVAACRHAKDVAVDVPGYGRVHGDVAWGGNWFFLCTDHGLDLSADNVVALTARAEAIRQALEAAAITGADGAQIDHIELVGPAKDARHHGRNFVLCPGMAYDRSPCGTGTSAKLACLAADRHLAPGVVWHQESVIGSVFDAHYQPGPEPGQVLPFIHGKAYVTLDATLVFDPHDPYAWGLA